MAKNTEVQPPQVEPQVALQQYHFPAYGITVEAPSLEEAEKKLHSLTQD